MLTNFGAGCAKAAGIELKPLEECYKGEAGKKLDAKARKQTDGLQPPHTYVPWVSRVMET